MQNVVSVPGANTSMNPSYPGAFPLASEKKVLQGQQALPPYAPFSSGGMGRPSLIQSPPAPITMSSTAPVVSQSIQLLPFAPQFGSPFHPLPTMPPQHQAPWSHPPQMGGFQLPTFLPYPGVLPGPLPTAMHPLPMPAVIPPDSQAPDVSSIGNTTYAIPIVSVSGEKDYSA